MYKENPRYIEFPRILEPRGNLTYIEGENTVPFPIKRIYYINGIPDNSTKRGGHAHKGVKEVIAVISGTFEIVCDNGFEKTHFHILQPSIGLYIPEMVWVELYNFSKDAICLVLSSEYYNEMNYVRKYKNFIREVKKQKRGRKK